MMTSSSTSASKWWATWIEIKHVLSAALADRGAVGMEITIFNPRLDTDGKVLRAFMDMLTSAFLNK
jgi:arginase